VAVMTNELITASAERPIDCMAAGHLPEVDSAQRDCPADG